MIAKRSVRDIDVAEKTVLVRVDYNVPFVPGTTEISDDSRISASLPTVRYLIEHRCKVVLCSHLGRPDGKVVQELHMAPVSNRLSELLGMPVTQASDCTGEEVHKAVSTLPAGGVMLLENLRFHAGEESNDPEFASELASLAQVCVNDAFGTAHRAQASTQGVTQFLPSVAGFLMERELQMLGRVLESPRRPLAAILGGAKVSDKIAVLNNLTERVDTLVIGGCMAATFLVARGHSVGDTFVEDDRVPFARELIETARKGETHLVLPIDVVIADAFSADANVRTVDVANIPAGWLMMDIGPRTASLFEEALRPSLTVMWNGPMGVCEWGPFAQGTVRIVNFLAGVDPGVTTVVGGGSTAEAVESLGLRDKLTHVSTGGGATLEFLEGRALPGVEALMDRDRSQQRQPQL